jgi:hypothetical protein
MSSFQSALDSRFRVDALEILIAIARRGRLGRRVFAVEERHDGEDESAERRCMRNMWTCGDYMSNARISLGKMSWTPMLVDYIV